MHDHQNNVADSVAVAEPAPVEGTTAPADDLTSRLNDIVKEAQRVQRLRHEWETIKAEADDASKRAKEAKTIWEGASTNLERLCIGEKEQFPLWEKNGAAPISEVTPADESWRETLIETLDLSDSTCTKLYDAGINNLGQLADWTAGGKLLTDIDGIGPRAVERIEGATTAFWKDRATQAEPASSEAVDEPSEEPEAALSA